MPLFKKCKCEEPCVKEDCKCRCHGFIRRHKLIRRIAAAAGAAVGMYFIGKARGWW